MKRQGGLFERVVAFDNLLLAARKAARGKRDKAPVARFEFHLEPALLRLQDELIAGRYRPGSYVSFEVRDPKRRKICAAPYRDRVLHHAICNVLEPVLECRQIFDSYACRPGKGSHAAIARAQQYARCYRYFVKCDVRKFFDSVNHAMLKALLARVLKDRPLLALLNKIIDHSPPDAAPGRGLPIGNLTSQHFANLYLGELDHTVKDRWRVKGYLRYMDDILFFADDKPSLHNLLVDTRQFLRDTLHLTLKEEATLLAPVAEGIPFLGFRIYPGMLRLNPRTLRRFRRQVRICEKAYQAGDLSMAELSNSVASLFAHVSHADSLQLRRQVVKVSRDLG